MLSYIVPILTCVIKVTKCFNMPSVPLSIMFNFDTQARINICILYSYVCIHVLFILSTISPYYCHYFQGAKSRISQAVCAWGDSESNVCTKTWRCMNAYNVFSPFVEFK